MFFFFDYASFCRQAHGVEQNLSILYTSICLLVYYLFATKTPHVTPETLRYCPHGTENRKAGTARYQLQPGTLVTYFIAKGSL